MRDLRRLCYDVIMTPKVDEPREKPHGTWMRAGTDSSAATVFAGNIMALVAVALLFDDDEDGPKRSD